jgi:hypothetical protein
MGAGGYCWGVLIDASKGGAASAAPVTLEDGNEGRTPSQWLIPREAGVQLLADRRRDTAVDAKRSAISG